ncbi:HYC_CC_PP family protein [Altibacter sp. HG106]|uniref:HYC_CC_PP family protein n=1 Tax=Altibacter sp. HG106 TaxID=3023937 RepID=UPI002350E2CA|nr:hypothetical protein [Altibacter sp. HG106]MDC7995490.1 hypothetical protein [Altibacter sp. HG106]
MKQSISILLSLLLLLSSSGLSYAQHFCGDYEMLAKVTLGEQHLSCGMAMESSTCDGPSDTHGCCDNHFTKVDTDDHFSKASFDMALDTTFVIAFASVFVLDIPVVNSKETTALITYRPPPLERDIQVWYEVFLI